MEIQKLNNMIKITKVRFNPDYDGVSALYINDILYKYGDPYHHRIDDWIKGFQEGIGFVNNAELLFTTIEVRDEKICDDICETGNPPDNMMIYG